MRGAVWTAALCLMIAPAAWGAPQAAGPFEEMVFEAPAPRSHLLAYGSIAAGAGLIGASFLFSEHANDVFRDYERSTDPARIDELFTKTQRYDRYASAALFAGEVLLATGLYLRFLRYPPDARAAALPAPGARLSLSLGPRRCALVWQL